MILATEEYPQEGRVKVVYLYFVPEEHRPRPSTRTDRNILQRDTDKTSEETDHIEQEKKRTVPVPGKDKRGGSWDESGHDDWDTPSDYLGRQKTETRQMERRRHLPGERDTTS